MLDITSDCLLKLPRSRGAPDRVTRRAAIALGAGALICPTTTFASTARRIKWTELIPEGTPYSEIIGQGTIDSQKDIWIPEFDQNGNALNSSLNGEKVILAGYVVPLELLADGVTEFLLVPFVGACIHVPPPPPNQLVFVTTDVPWPQGNLWDAVLVTGKISVNMQRTEIAQIGYEMTASYIEDFEP